MDYLRSFLFVPGSNLRVIHKALASTADAVIIDLEDAVSVTEKEIARAQVVELLNSIDCSRRVYVRINGWDTPWGEADLEATVATRSSGIVLPKAEDPVTVAEIAELLPAGFDFIPLVETAKGVLNAYAVATCSGRISRLAFGAVDFSLDIGVEYSKTGAALLYARSHLVVVSQGAGLLSPVDTIYPDLQDLSGLAAELDRVHHLGMFGKLAIHPKQLDLIHAAFTPDTDEIAEAHEIVRVFEAAEKEGVAAMKIHGKFIDYPVYRSAQKIVSLAQMLAGSSRSDQ